MGQKENARAVRGSGSDPISTTQTAAFEVDNYDEADKLQGSTYPLTSDPTFTVQDWVILQNPGGKTVDLTTASGTTVTGLELGSALIAVDTLRVDSITINDDGATGGTTSVLLIGE